MYCLIWYCDTVVLVQNLMCKTFGWHHVLLQSIQWRWKRGWKSQLELLTFQFCWFSRFGEHEGSYCTVASFDTDGSMTATASNVKTNNIMTPLQVSIATDHNPLHESATASHAWSNQGHHQRSPSRSSSSSSSGSISHRSKLSPASSSSSLASLSPPIRSTQPHQYRACFYPNYEPQVRIQIFHLKWLMLIWYTISIHQIDLSGVRDLISLFFLCRRAGTPTVRYPRRSLLRPHRLITTITITTNTLLPPPPLSLLNPARHHTADGAWPTSLPLSVIWLTAGRLWDPW